MRPAPGREAGRKGPGRAGGNVDRVPDSCISATPGHFLVLPSMTSGCLEGAFYRQTTVRRYSLGVMPDTLRKAPLNELAEPKPMAMAISVTD